jgi:sugar/nucleoside kinase (ribokinase family)
MTRILTIGDAMLDVLVKVDSEINFDSDTRAKITTCGGGAAANSAAWLAKTGVTTDFFGAVGADSSGRIFLDELKISGVKSRASIIEGAQTGTVVVFVANDGERTMFPDTGANSGLRAHELPDPSEFAAILLSGYSLFNPLLTIEVESMIKRIRETKTPLALDPASVGIMEEFGLAQLRGQLSKFDLLLLNEAEAAFISGEANCDGALKYLLRFVPNVVIKRGAAGAIAGTQSGDYYTASAKATKVIDTTGAGDAFNAGFFATWVKTGRIDAALESGVSLAAECVATIGARPRVGA